MTSAAEQIAQSTVRIESLFSNGNIARGTGFFVRFFEVGEKKVTTIVTNKHVIAGAQSIRFSLSILDAAKNIIPRSHEEFVLDLSKIPVALHPDKDVDLAAIAIGGVLNHMVAQGKDPATRTMGLEDIPTQDQLNELRPIEDILMVGYPNGLWDKVNNNPIIRRGITATPAYENYEGRSEFVIDAACFPGSSGSPVFILNEGSYATRSGNGISIGIRFIPLGVLYAGPQMATSGEIVVKNIPTVAVPVPVVPAMMNLGFCIKMERLKDIAPVLAAMVGPPPT